MSQHAKVLSAIADAPGASLNACRGEIRIEDDGWVAADAMVLPGVTVGAGAILGARATARESLAPWTMFGGEPLRALGRRAKPGGIE